MVSYTSGAGARRAGGTGWDKSFVLQGVPVAVAGLFRTLRDKGEQAKMGMARRGNML